MSITFWCPEAPTVTVTPYPQDEPDYTEERSTLPELNVSNSNGMALLAMVGLEVDYGGTVPVAELDALHKRLERLLGTPTARAAFIEPTVIEGTVPLDVLLGRSPGVVGVPRASGPQVVSMGRTDDYLTSRLQALLDLVCAAKEHGFRISWG